MNRKLGLGVLFALGALCAGCDRDAKTEGPQAPVVKACTVGGDDGDSLELRGSVASQGRLRLGFKQPGVIGSIRVREGEKIHAGQVLAVLDEIDAQSQLRTAKAALDRARRDSDRAARLVAEGALPMNQRDDARNQLEACEAQWLQAQDGVARTRLVAPVSGTVFQRLAEPGETLPVGNPVLVLDTTDHLVVKAGLTERELKRLKLGQDTLIVPEDGSPLLRGRVTSLGASPNAADGQYALEVTPDRGFLRPGALVAIRFEKRERAKSGVRVPFGALVHRQDQDFVFVVERNGSAEIVKARPVALEKADGSGVLLRSGLAPGTRLVAEGAFFLQDGQAVRSTE